MSPRPFLPAVAAFALAFASGARAQEIRRHDRHPTLPIVKTVTVPGAAETLYLSGEVPSVVNTAAPVNTPEAYGDTEAQTLSVMHKIEQTLARRGYGLGEVVKLNVFLVGPSGKQGRLDIEGFTRAYIRFFGTTAQPNLAARSVVQVVALGNPGHLIEIEAIAARIRTSNK